MPRRQILSSEEQERLLVIPDDEIILTRMCFLNEPDIALINKHRRPANRLALLYYSVICVDLDLFRTKAVLLTMALYRGCFPTETSA